MNWKENDILVLNNTVLPMTVFVSDRNTGIPSVKICDTYEEVRRLTYSDLITILLNGEPRLRNTRNKRRHNLKKKDIETAISWVKENQKILLDFWYKRIKYGKMIRKLCERIRVKPEDRYGFFLTGLTQKCTGLPMVVYASSQNTAYPWIMVCDGYASYRRSSSRKAVEVLIKDDPRPIGKKKFKNLKKKDILLVYEWIKINKKVLMDHWDTDIDSARLWDGIKQLNNG